MDTAPDTETVTISKELYDFLAEQLESSAPHQLDLRPQGDGRFEVVNRKYRDSWGVFSPSAAEGLVEICGESDNSERVLEQRARAGM